MSNNLRDLLNNELREIKSLLLIMTDHFDWPRDKENLAVDHYNLTRYFYNYNDLLSIALDKIKGIEEILKESEK